jgi:transposase
VACPVAKSVHPASKLGQALNCVRNPWQALNEYAEDGRLPIDNNWVERLMKRVAAGKKNRLFVGSLRAGIRNSNLMTLVASAHRQDLDVYEYLRDVIEHLNRGTAAPSELLPDVWKASHREAIRTYREVDLRDKADQARLRNAARRLLA